MNKEFKHWLSQQKYIIYDGELITNYFTKASKRKEKYTWTQILYLDKLVKYSRLEWNWTISSK